MSNQTCPICQKRNRHYSWFQGNSEIGTKAILARKFKKTQCDRSSKVSLAIQFANLVEMMIHLSSEITMHRIAHCFQAFTQHVGHHQTGNIQNFHAQKPSQQSLCFSSEGLQMKPLLILKLISNLIQLYVDIQGMHLSTLPITIQLHHANDSTQKFEEFSAKENIASDQGLGVSAMKLNVASRL